jgi:fructose/tagatose bisphosphate aldolase
MNDRKDIDAMVAEAVFGDSERTSDDARRRIGEMARAAGMYPASIQGLYEASGKGLYHGITVPAINIRGITYDVARAVFRAALKDKVGAFIFELARSEMGYTRQAPSEYAACVLAAGIAEGFRGPVFIQVDHTQVKRMLYRQNPAAELKEIKGIIKDAIDSGFYNIDIDASTLVDIDKPALSDQQAANCKITADLTRYIREIEPEGVTISVGGEIGEIGKGNSTVEDLDAFMKGYLEELGGGVKGISKISVQTGTSHGGVVLPDGSIADVSIDFETLRVLSARARQKYGMGGAVQHGASTLPDEAFDHFPQVDTLEVHLATGFQNIIMDSPSFPGELTESIKKDIAARYGNERKSGETDEQFIYKTRKKSFGDFKEQLWHLPEKSHREIMKELEDRFSLIYHKLNVLNTVELVGKYVKKP